MPAYAPLLEDLRDYLDPKPLNRYPKVFMTWDISARDAVKCALCNDTGWYLPKNLERRGVATTDDWVKCGCVTEDRNLAIIDKWLAGQITDAELYAQIEVTE